jgi:hypothetical protein
VNGELTARIAELERETASFSPTTVRHLMIQRYLSTVRDGEKRLVSELRAGDRAVFLGTGYSLFDDAPMPPNFAGVFGRLQAVDRERRKERATARSSGPSVQ